MKTRLVVTITAVLALGIGILIPSLLTALVAGGLFLSAQFQAPAADPEAEYYRGLYDACVALTHQRSRCLDQVTASKARGWYEQPSEGWRWPLPDASVQPAGQGQEFEG
jgi:hypothetical protein